MQPRARSPKRAATIFSARNNFFLLLGTLLSALLAARADAARGMARHSRLACAHTNAIMRACACGQGVCCCSRGRLPGHLVRATGAAPRARWPEGSMARLELREPDVPTTDPMTNFHPGDPSVTAAAFPFPGRGPWRAWLPPSAPARQRQRPQGGWRGLNGGGACASKMR